MEQRETSLAVCKCCQCDSNVHIGYRLTVNKFSSFPRVQTNKSFPNSSKRERGYPRGPSNSSRTHGTTIRCETALWFRYIIHRLCTGSKPLYQKHFGWNQAWQYWWSCSFGGKLNYGFILATLLLTGLFIIGTAAARKWHGVEDNNISLNWSGISINTPSELALLLGKLIPQSDNNCCCSVPSPYDIQCQPAMNWLSTESEQCYIRELG